ncbi:MAG: BON domain-containing protein [Candidatus Omnitrophica bacterium]|nr:BON domain-containing protein [Candidatus Omnitrophota bacterium]MCF7877348.1 BON domain-containing protein [Candidatus Omnitrophota bacterium]MCF7892452.1 BON domain-containing protein [Candidatus Omnitrophota bacterium]MCF7895451.1 BON domain-containing protein [Candidatus Omnitrophota bacterium]MCF7897831.1 BON domain-containing protein [Candidatus Omnitrophota bacterium]
MKRIEKNNIWILIVFSAMALFSSGKMALAQEKLPDPAIGVVVMDALIKDQRIDSNWIDIEVNDGIAILDGSVEDILTKERAAKLAATVKGVRGVVNDLKVEAIEVKDSELKQDIENTLAWNSATDSWEIEAEVNNQQVALTGQVESYAEQQLAAKVVKKIEGVKEVENKIEIEYPVERSDYEIKQDVKARLSWNRYVDHALIDIAVDNGDVSLTGTVGSFAEKSKAYALAWVTGVDSVDNSGLKVEGWAREDRFRKDKYVNKTDQQIEDAVEDALFYDPRVIVANVDVSVDKGIATLTGKVESLKAKRSATQTAKNTVGVWRVKNQLQVRPSTPTDAKIEARVETGLETNPYLEDDKVEVKVNNGKATLTGLVDWYFEKAEAEDTASQVYGVTSVNNNIAVENNTYIQIHDPYVDDFAIYEYKWYTHPDTITTLNDWEIAEEIRSELWWSPFVDRDEINVSVEDGVATLTGEVDSWGEWGAAQENAYEGGAVYVKNRLNIDYGPKFLF